jgi:hypothetical protein
MSSYVHPENQQLLWNILQNTELVTQFFSKYEPIHKERWFKSVIQMFYEKNKHIHIDLQELNRLNRETLSYMISSIRERVTEPPSLSAPAPVPNPTPAPVPNPNPTPAPVPAPSLSQPPSTAFSRENIQHYRQEAFQSQFQERQKEYESLLEKKSPTEIDFREKEKDTAITNMDDLIKNHIQQREEELKKLQMNVQPPVSVPTEPLTNKMEKQPVNEPEKKKVSWSSDAPVIHDSIHSIINTSSEMMERINMQFQEINTLRTVVLELTKDLKSLKQEVAVLKTQPTPLISGSLL